MRDYKAELEKRAAYVREAIAAAGADGIVFNNSGGKDCTLVGAICKHACENTVALILPCQSSRNFGEDKNDAEASAKKFGFTNRVIDLTGTKESLTNALTASGIELNSAALTNINPRLRMICAYAVAAAENRLVAGTGNRSEAYMGYFTKWGDGAYDINPIADLTVTEIYEFLRYLGAPENIITKAPSAGLFEGQTDEGEMGVTYAAIDGYLLEGKANEKDLAIIERFHKKSEHKRHLPSQYSGS
ncbi:MAG: NAD(+) synthase [Firmicutes bacterium]|nr:NAD(+) synthase [Bacillota bacterium]